MRLIAINRLTALIE